MPMQELRWKRRDGIGDKALEELELGLQRLEGKTETRATPRGIAHGERSSTAAH
jgi:hypothetical protein